jgi:hypothetical protein
MKLRKKGKRMEIGVLRKGAAEKRRVNTKREIKVKGKRNRNKDNKEREKRE